MFVLFSSTYFSYVNLNESFGTREMGFKREIVLNLTQIFQLCKYLEKKLFKKLYNTFE